jgi:hypothetical protein
MNANMNKQSGMVMNARKEKADFINDLLIKYPINANYRCIEKRNGKYMNNNEMRDILTTISQKAWMVEMYELEVGLYITINMDTLTYHFKDAGSKGAYCGGFTNVRRLFGEMFPIFNDLKVFKYHPILSNRTFVEWSWLNMPPPKMYRLVIPAMQNMKPRFIAGVTRLRLTRDVANGDEDETDEMEAEREAVEKAAAVAAKWAVKAATAAEAVEHTAFCRAVGARLTAAKEAAEEAEHMALKERWLTPGDRRRAARVKQLTLRAAQIKLMAALNEHAAKQ